MEGSSEKPTRSISRNSSHGGKQDGNSALTATSSGAGQQIIFRIRNGLMQDRRRVRMRESQQSPSGEREPVYRPRKPHRKSRAGCENCKKRKVKCDETRPGCRKCLTYGVPCSYSALHLTSRMPEEPQPDYPASMTESSGDIDIVDTPSPLPLPAAYLSSKIDQALRFDTSMERDVRFALPSAKSKDAMILNHFLNSTVALTSASETHKAVACTDMMQLAFECPHLMHAILGAAATHLARLLPSEQSYKVSEGYHWQQAIRLYQKALTTTITTQNMDFLMSTCMLLTVAALSSEDFSPATSWVFSSDPTALNWLLVQSGLRHLLEYTSPWLNHSIWCRVFKQSDDGYKTFNDNRPGDVGLHRDLAELCEIDETTTGETNPYHGPLRVLSPILPLEHNAENFPKTVTFMGRLLPKYTDLLLNKDHRAMLILAFWLAKMCHHNWWARARAISECTAICMYLEHSEDPRILELLEYPASMCGYPLTHRQGILAPPSTSDLVDCSSPGDMQNGPVYSELGAYCTQLDLLTVEH